MLSAQHEHRILKAKQSDQTYGDPEPQGYLQYQSQQRITGHQPMPTKSTKEKLVTNNTPPPTDLKEKAHRHSEAPKATNNNNLATSNPEPLIAPSFSGHMEIILN